MALRSTGAISMADINLELSKAAAAVISLNDSNARTLAAIASGAISLASFYGKSSAITIAVVSNVQNLNIKSAAIAAGWNGTSPITVNVTVNSGVIVSSASTGSPAVTTDTGWPAGCVINLTNNGIICGKGGNGGVGNTTWAVTESMNGTAGGVAISALQAIVITNNNIIGGGGGGGGGGDVNNDGGGCCGGQAGNPGSGGAGFGIGATSEQWSGPSPVTAPSGTATSGGAAYQSNINGGCCCTVNYGGAGGAGGGLGAAGSSGSPGYDNCIGTHLVSGVGSGGAAGACTQGNANITWVAPGNRYGALN